MPNAKQYYENLETKANELNEKYENLRKEEATNPRVFFVEGKVKIEKEIVEGKLYNLYSCLVKRLPEDKKHELNEYLKPLFYIGESRTENFKKRFEKELKAGRYDFEFFTFRLLKGNKAEIIEKIASNLSEKDIEEAINENDQYVSPNQKVEKVKILDKEVTAAKAYVESTETDPAKKQAILEELDLINELVVTANKELKTSMDDLEKNYESGRNKLYSNQVDSYIEKNKPESYKFLDRQCDDNSFINENKAAENVEKFKETKNSIKFNLSEQNKKATLKVLKAIESMGILDPKDDGNEQSTKIYGFRQIYDTQKAIREALESHDFSNLKVLRENYTKAVENMKELFALVKEEFNPGPENAVGNLSNLRHDYVPFEFVEDVVTNATVSSLYNMLTIIKRLGCTPEEFVNDPTKYLDELREQIKNTDLNIDVRSKGKSIVEALSHPIFCGYIIENKDHYPTFTIQRVVEGIKNRETDQKIKDELCYNSMFYSAFDTVFSTYSSGNRDKQSYMAPHYLNTEGVSTIANILLVNDEDRVYSKLRAHAHYDPKDDLTIVKPFDVKGYLATTRVDPVELKNRIVESVKEMYTLCKAREQFYTEQREKGANVKKEPSLIHMHFEQFMKGAQKSIQLYLLLQNPSISGVKDEPGIADLVSLLKDPTKMLDGIENIDEVYLKDINALKNADKTIENFKKEANKVYKTDIKSIIANERKAESKFNKDANTITQEIEKLQAEDKDATAQFIKLQELMDKEMERLEDLYNNDLIPKSYFETRRILMRENDYKTKAPFLDDSILSKSDFIRLKGTEFRYLDRNENDEYDLTQELSKEEINGLYESYKLQVQIDKQVFMNSRLLIDKGYIKSSPNVSKEPIHEEKAPELTPEEIQARQKYRKYISPIIKSERKAESEFNKKAKELQQEIVTLREQSKDYSRQPNIAKNEDSLQTQLILEDALEDLVTNERNRLEELYKNNLIPHSYYEIRCAFIRDKNFTTETPFLDDKMLSKEEFIKYKENKYFYENGEEIKLEDEFSYEEIDGLYQAYKIEVQHEKDEFISDMVKAEEEKELAKNAKKDMAPVKIHVDLDGDENDIQPITNINDVSKQKTVEKTDEINK